MKKAALTKLLAGLAELLKQLAEAETPKPTPKVSPAPPHSRVYPTKIVPSATGHQAFIKPDGALCCSVHDEAFEASCRHMENTFRFIPFWR